MGDYFQMIMALVGVLAIVFVMFWLMRKMNKTVFTSDSRNMKILERVSLGPDKMLLLVSVCGRLMVLGVTSSHTEVICELSETEEQLYPKSEDGKNPTFGESFKTVLGNMMNKNK